MIALKEEKKNRIRKLSGIFKNREKMGKKEMRLTVYYYFFLANVNKTLVRSV